MAAAIVTFSYDATTQTYTVGEGGSSLAFGPANLLSSVAGLNTYEIVSGTTVERLVLATGTDGAYDRADRKYAVIGRWLTSTNNGSGASYQTRSFTYGFPTTAGSLPATGRASYTVTLLGSRSSINEPSLLALSGFGQLLVDFGAGSVGFFGSLISSRADGGAANVVNITGLANGTATIASGSNGFTGTMTASFRNGVEVYSGTLSGLFYGPGGAEIGGTARGDIGGGPTIDFAFAGPGVANVTTGDTLASLNRETGFLGVGAIDSALVGTTRANPGAVPIAISAVVYDPASGSYTVSVANGAVTGLRDSLTFAPADRAPAQDTADFTAYSRTTTDGTHQWRVFDGSTAGVTLTYASFVELLTTQRDSGGTVTGNLLEYYSIGSPTPLHQLPVSGTASYTGALLGQARGSTGLFLYPVSGTSALSVDFGSGAFTASLSPVRADSVGGAVGSGPFTWTGLVNKISGGFGSASTSNTLHSGIIAGMFYGPAAQEFAAAFSVHDNSIATTIDGMAFGTQTPAP